jgi:hypothetical protein
MVAARDTAPNVAGRVVLRETRLRFERFAAAGGVIALAYEVSHILAVFAYLAAVFAFVRCEAGTRAVRAFLVVRHLIVLLARGPQAARGLINLDADRREVQAILIKPRG